jgi:hypothetical protein
LKKGRKKKLNSDEKQIINDVIDANRELSTREIQKNKELNLKNCCLSTICNLSLNELDFRTMIKTKTFKLTSS